MYLNKIILLLIVGCSTVPKETPVVDNGEIKQPVEVVNPVVKEPVKDNSNVNIELIVSQSACKDFYFNDWDGEKQKAPFGYLLGLAKSFHQSNCKATQDTSKWAQLISHGLWESSGKYCEGADLSSGRPNSITSISAEAGFAQTSYDAIYGVSGLKEYIASWQGECFTEDFSKGFKCSEKNLKNYGDSSSLGYKFQQRAKSCGAFAADVMIQTWPIRSSHYFTYKKNLVQEVKSCVVMFEEIKGLGCVK